MDVLVVEDDPGIGRALQKGFRETRHGCVWVRTGPAGLEEARTQRFDAVVLDLLLPGQPGMAVLRQLRAEGIRTPVVILTALGAVEERVAGLRAGADDYLVKPFAMVEVLARLEAVCRRTADRPAAVIEDGGLRLDLTTRRVTAAGVEIQLSPTEFSLLELLMRHAGQVVTRKMLCEHLWDADWEGVTNVVEVHVTRLRAKLQRCGKDSLISTVRGRGYAFRTA